MTYAVQQDLIDRFGNQEVLELSDRSNTGSIDATVVSRALTDADAEINGYLDGRYTLPLTTVPTVIVRLAADIARYYLYDDRVTDAVKARYNDAVGYLQSVAKGIVSLGLDASNAQAVPSPGVKIISNDRVFTNGSPSRGVAGTLDDF
jgi:phage gp36-like protein